MTRFYVFQKNNTNKFYRGGKSNTLGPPPNCYVLEEVIRSGTTQRARPLRVKDGSYQNQIN